jgi:hypothetical protein
MSSIVTLHVQLDEDASIRWCGNFENIPILDIAGHSHHLTQLGADLGPWLLDLSDQLAKFATTVTPEGTPVLAGVSA